MKPITALLFLSFLTSFSPSIANAQDPSYVSFLITTNGLDFLKDTLISEAISSLTPLHIPSIEQSHRIPLLGNVHFLISNITINHVDVSHKSSFISPGETGVSIVVSDATANLSLDWHYSYFAGWFLPVEISDRGLASVQVDGMQVGVTFNLSNQEGRVKLSLVECGCYIEDLTIKLSGGASWLYQWFVDAFVGQIESSVETAITQSLRDGTLKLDSSLQSLPKEIPVDDAVSLNLTFIGDPIVCNTSIEFDVSGLFTSSVQTWNSELLDKHVRSFSCDDQSKMVGISIDEAVFQSASNLYFEAGQLQWTVDKIPDQALLNTAGWRFIIPQLYKKYPNDDMNLHVSFASPPALRISSNNIDVAATVDIIINVLEGGEAIPVACILMELKASGSVNFRGNSLGGKVKLGDLKMSLQWSKIGNLKMFLIQPVIWTVVETVLLPYTNTRLWKGFPLPMIRGFTLRSAKIRNSDSILTICTDIAYTELRDLTRPLIGIS